MSVGSSVSRWGDGDPGVGMTGVQVRVLGGAVGMAASVQRAHRSERPAQFCGAVNSRGGLYAQALGAKDGRRPVP